MRHPGLMAGVLVGLLSGCLPTLEDECSAPSDCAAGQICRAGLCVAANGLAPDGDVPGAGGNRPGGGPDGGGEPRIDARVDDVGPVEDAAPPVCADEETLCDGRDDDCDGQTDEGLQVGTPCSIGQGACEAQGALGCGVGGAVVCSAAVVAPADENCDGRDNDCDGRTDEDIRQPCYTGPPGTADTGACRPGRTECSDGTIGRCLDQVLPRDEPAACDGVDDDCDGAVDEAVVGQPCYPGDDAWLAAPMTACRAGTQACADGEISCAGARLPDDVDGCNGVNDDCDGEVDEDCTCVDGEPCAAGEGVCVPGTQVCNGPALIECTDRQVALAETCNGADDDCDGRVDEGADAACEGNATGLCDPGVRRCIAGRLAEACTGRVEPAAAEACDGRDDDCDGAVDETFPDLGEPCSVGVGACRRAGVRACAPDGAAGCSVTAGAAGTETCNGLDDDCDGDTDEDASVPCWPDPNATAAPCSQGMRVCAQGMLAAACTGGQGPVAEICGNQIDEDCDGAADDGCVCNEGARRPCGAGNNVCRPGEQTCRSNAWSACQGIVYGVPEICDGIDNDCDGPTDEDVAPESCYQGPAGTAGVGICRAGTRTCTNGQRGACLGQTRPLPEDLCNGDDDDCDGTLDEDGVGDEIVACDTGRPGLCALGNAICAEETHTVVCTAAHDPAPDDVCDGLDQDCDGFADEAVEREFGPIVLSRMGTAVGVDAAWTPSGQRLAVVFTEGGVRAPSVALLDGGGAASGSRALEGVPAGQAVNRVAIVGVELPDGLLDGILEGIFGDAEPDLAAAFGTGMAIGINFFSSTNANLSAPEQLVASGDVGGFDLAFGGERAVVSFAEHGQPNDLVRMRRMGPTGASTEPAVTLHTAMGRVDSTALAAGTGDHAMHYGVAWRTAGAGGSGVFFGVYDAAGQVVVNATRLSLIASPASAPSVTWDGQRFVVAFAQGVPQRPALVYVDPDDGGTTRVDDIDGAGLVGMATEPPVVAAAGGISRIVWIRSDSRAVHLRTFGRDAAPRAAPTRVLAGGALQAPISVAPLGNNGEAVAWVRLVRGDEEDESRHTEVTFGQLLCAAP
ncbi:MAG: hypothetical protein H6704_15535 [Myxococcales bacterium]|nr:hypothetical protein [Myxococcales bacterium]